jgi:uncharacterized membrane protein
MSETPTTRVQEIWQCQPVEGIKMSADEIRNRALKFEKRIFWRNAREYAGALIAVVVFAVSFVKTDDLGMRAAFAVLIAGLGYVVYEMHKRAAAIPASEMGTKPYLQFHREELERQHDYLCHIWRWYLGPLVPGMLALAAASVRLAHARLHGLSALQLLKGLGPLVVIVLLFVFIWKINQWAANALQKQIDELRAAEERP